MNKLGEAMLTGKYHRGVLTFTEPYYDPTPILEIVNTGDFKLCNGNDYV